MNPRLIILIIIAAGMAIYFATVAGGSKPTDPLVSDAGGTFDPVTQVTLDQRDLPGSEPPEAPDLSVKVEVDRSHGKNRLYFTINEAHGYYVEQFRVRFWSVKNGEKSPEESPLNVTQFFDQYLQAKSTLRLCMEVVPAELVRVGGDIGDSDDWASEIVMHGRARAQNPEPLPPRTHIVDCD